MLDAPNGKSTEEPSGPRRSKIARLLGLYGEWAALLVSLVAYAAFATYLSNLRSENFFTSAWDLGINQQLLWTTAHGRLLYEAPDLEFYGAHSFLQVHSTYIAFVVAPLYANWPSPVTLFALQSAIFALSGIPLYYIARKTLRHRELAIATLAFYLASFAMLAGLMYDFHWEAFLPVEFLTFYILVVQRRFGLSILLLVIGTLTLEVFPFLAAAVLVLVIVERAESVRFRWRPLLRDPTARTMVVLLGVALFAYLMVRVLQYVVIPSVLGVPSVSEGNSTGPALLFGFAANTATLPHSAGYWFLLLATLGFLPLLSPRHLILSVPWFYFSVFVSPVFSAYFGGAQVFVAVPALAVAAVFGLNQLEKVDWSDMRFVILESSIVAGSVFLMALALLPGESARLLSYGVGPAFWVSAVLLVAASVIMAILTRTSSRVAARPRRVLSRRVRRWALSSGVATLVVVVLVFDAALSPFNSANFDATRLQGYEFQFGENPTAAQMPWITSFLPTHAEVLASDRLFPYVANNPNAWAVPWFVISATNPVPYFPFTPSNLPEFVLADAWEFGFIPGFLQRAVFNGSLYGLVAYVYATYFPGSIYLFERGFQGTPLGRDLSPRQSNYAYTPVSLDVGPAGIHALDPSSPFGSVITSVPIGPINNTTATVWYGPYAEYLPGNYTVTFSLEGYATNPTGLSTPIAYVDATWAGEENVSTFFRLAINASQLSPTTWTRISVPLELTYPYPNVEFRGFLALASGRSFASLTLASIVVADSPS